MRGLDPYDPAAVSIMRPDQPPDRPRLDDETVDEDIDGEELEEEELDEELAEEELDVDVDAVLGADDEAVDVVDVVVATDEDEEADVPAARRKPAGEDEEDDDEDVDPDDVEADLDAILKDRIAASDDDEEDEDEQVDDRSDPDVGERVAAKSAEEFTCSTCFMIVHPRQFGRADHLVCPEGYDPCPSIPLVAKRLKKAAKK
jgi:hypothetical protein